MFEDFSKGDGVRQLYVFMMVDRSVEEEVEMHFSSLLDRGFELEFVDFDGTESLEELAGLYPFDLAVIDADQFVPTSGRKMSGYEIAWELLQLDKEVRIMLMGEGLLEENQRSSRLKDNVVVYKKAANLPISSPDSFRQEIEGFLQSRSILEKLHDFY